MRAIHAAVLCAARAAHADDPDAELVEETIEIVADAPPRAAEPPPAVVTGEDIRVLAGARGDAIEAIRNLPGVAFAASGQGSTGDLAIRGTSGSDSWYLVDGIAVPAAMHLGGLTAILPVELIQAVELRPGGFDVAYGRATGGVIELTTRAGRPDRWRAAGDLSFVHASAYAEGPVWGDRATLIAGVRRSFLDLVLPAVIGDDAEISFTRAPVYADAQLRLDVTPAPRHTVTLLGLASDEKLAVVAAGEQADPLFTGLASAERFWRAAATWRYDGRRADARAIASIGTDEESFAIGPAFGFALDALAAAGRFDLRLEATDAIAIRTGLDAQTVRFDIAGRAPVGASEGRPDPMLSLDPAFALDTELVCSAAAAYGAVDLRPVRAVLVTPGVRVERYGPDDVVVEPRVATELVLPDRWTVRAALGRFSRTHDQLKIAAAHLRAERSTQASAGVERRLGELRVGATVFGSWLSRLATFDPMLATPEAPLAGYTNAGTGTARGVELVAELRRDDLFAWFAYTFTQSRRVDAPGLAERVFDQDQPHNLVAAASWRYKRWRFGGRFRLASGTPDTPILGAVYVADRDVYRPIYGPTNSTRLPGTHQLDLRVDRELARAPVKLSAYVDVANVYANPRVSGFAYDFDYRNRTEQTELPFTPSIGLRGEL